MTVALAAASRQLASAPHSDRLTATQARFAQTAGRLWFRAEELAATISYGLADGSAALRSNLAIDSTAQPLPPLSGTESIHIDDAAPSSLTSDL